MNKIKKHRRNSRRPNSRRGMTLVWIGLLMTGIMGTVGLVIDAGFLMASYRQTQNAADAGALAAATDLFRGRNLEAATASAVEFVTTHNSLTNAVVEVNNPPTSGAYAGIETKGNYVEVLVTYTVPTFFIHVLPGIDSLSEVKSRAVAGFESQTEGEGVIALDPRARPGLTVDGGATLWVAGSVIVNSRASGYDQYGNWLDTGYQQYAAGATNNSSVYASHVQVTGGVDWVDNFHNVNPAGPNPLFADARISPDPLSELPIPTPLTGANITPQGAVKIDQNAPKPTTLDPGMYEDILITQGAEAIFNPGIYILSPKKPNQGLRINGDANVLGEGVMFYATGSNYLEGGAGYYDQLDGPVELDYNTNQLPPPPDSNFASVDMATVDINATGATVKLTGLDDPYSPFDGLLFFQRRRNESAFSIQGKAGQNVTLGGTLYTKWAHFKLAGEGKYDAQFIVGSAQITGQAIVTILGAGENWNRALQVFLVE